MMGYVRWLYCFLVFNALPVLADEVSSESDSAWSDGVLKPDVMPGTPTEPAVVSDAAKGEGLLVAPESQKAPINYYVGFNYSYFDLIVPSKYGFSIGYIHTPTDTYEFEYLRASVSLPAPVIKELGTFSEVRMSLLDRHFFSGGSFNTLWGLVYNSNKLEIGNAILSRISSQNIPHIEPLEVATLGVVGGLGNRWRFSHGITIGADWFTWAQPMIVIKKENPFMDFVTNSTDKNNIDNAVRVLSYLPRLSVLKFNLGIVF